MAAIAFPAFDPIAFHVGPLSVRWYGLAYLAAFLAGWWVLRVLDEKWELGLGPDGRLTTVLAAVIGVVAGGRLGYVLFYNLPMYLAQPLRILALWDGGMSFHGGLAGVLLAGWWVAHHYEVSFLRLCDIGAIVAPIGFFFGRLANFVNGELWGRPASVAWAVVFPAAPLVGGVNLPRHPSQIYEAILEGLVIFVVMLVLQRRQRPDGTLIGWLLVLYAVFRIFVEFFREPDIQVGFLVGGVTMGQLLSLPVLAAGIWLLIRAGGRRATLRSQAGLPGPSGTGSRDEAPEPDIESR